MQNAGTSTFRRSGFRQPPGYLVLLPYDNLPIEAPQAFAETVIDIDGC